MKIRILSVGQCDADGSALAQFLEDSFAAELEMAGTADEAMSSLHNSPFDLVLINRVFAADGESGLDLIHAIKAESGIQHVPAMLISNFDDAQQEAMAAGAVLGFGKSQLGTDETIARLRTHLDGV